MDCVDSVDGMDGVNPILSERWGCLTSDDICPHLPQHKCTSGHGKMDIGSVGWASGAGNVSQCENQGSFI